MARRSIEEGCEAYIRARWDVLSQNARRLPEWYPEAFIFLRLQWQRDYYRERLIACEEELTREEPC